MRSNSFFFIKEFNHSILSYFDHGTKLPFNERKPEKSSLMKERNAKEVTINHKGTRMSKDGGDQH